MDELQQSIKELGDRITALTEEIEVMKHGNEIQDTQLQAVDTALSALRVARESKEAVKVLTEDTRMSSARIVALERLSTMSLRSIRAFLIAAGGYLLMQKSTDLWATTSLFDDKLADWLSMAAIACFAWALVVISDKEQRAIDLIQSLPFFRK